MEETSHPASPDPQSQPAGNANVTSGNLSSIVATMPPWAWWTYRTLNEEDVAPSLPGPHRHCRTAMPAARPDIPRASWRLWRDRLPPMHLCEPGSIAHHWAWPASRLAHQPTQSYIAVVTPYPACLAPSSARVDCSQGTSSK